MTLLAPWYLLAGLLAAAGVVALHLIAFDRPRVLLLPTARFAPAMPERARTRARRPADLALLALRVVALLLLALALARPVRTPTRAPLARVVLADVSASVARIDEVRDAVRALARPGDVIVAMGDSARAVATDSLRAETRPGSLTAGAVRALAVARGLARGADSAELVIVSPMVREEVDAATANALRAWEGRARHVPVAPAVASRAEAGRRIEVVGTAVRDDAVAAAVARLGARGAAETRIVRAAAPRSADSAWAREGRVLVAWPHAADSGTTRVRGLAWAGDALVAPLGTFAMDYDTDTSRAPAARVTARWEDGAPAVVERALGGGCVRDVRVGVSDRGDVALRTGMLRFVRALAEPCGERRDLAPVPPTTLGVRADAPARVLPRATSDDAWRIGRWLLGTALVLLLLEPLLRRRGADALGAAPAMRRAEAA